MKIIILSQHFYVRINFNKNNYHLNLIIKDNNFDWGRYDQDKDQWTGAVGRVNIL